MRKNSTPSTILSDVAFRDLPDLAIPGLQGGVKIWRDNQAALPFTLRDDDTVRDDAVTRRVTCRAAGRANLTRVSLLTRIPGGLVSEARISVPMARWLPDTPATAVRRRPRDFAAHDTEIDGQWPVTLSAPDCLAGTVVVTYGDRAVAITPLPAACAVNLYLYGDGEDVIIEQEFQRDARLAPGAWMEVAALVYHPYATESDGLAAVGRALATAGCAVPPDRQPWARELVVWEVEPGHHGGFRALIDQLETIRAQGFNALYLMPWHIGGYGTRDYRQTDPAFGSLEDLRALCDAAHARGLRVLFDLLVSVIAPESAYITEHPDWFYRDAAGNILPHPVWQGPCLDPASPGFRAFLTDYAARCCSEWGADGFRVDAVSHRGGLWDSPAGLQPYEHSQAIFTLLRDIRAAIRRVNPTAILMSETFGPQQVPWSDLICYQWVIWLDWLQTRLRAGEITGAVVQRLLAEHFAVLPPQTWMTLYTHTHDTLAFTGHDYQGAEIDALLALYTLAGAGVMVFGGGWKMPQRPLPEEETWFRSLLSLKAQLGGVAVGQVAFPTPSHPALCVFERPSALGPVRVITNLGNTPLGIEDAPRLYSRLGSAVGEILPFDTVVMANL